MKFRIEVLEPDEDPGDVYVYEFDSWEQAIKRLERFDGMAVSYTITHHYPDWPKPEVSDV